MKNYSLLMPLVLALCSCADAPAGLQITGKFTPTQECGVPEEDAAELATGNLDLAAGAGYVLGLNVVSTLEFTELVVGDNPINTPNDNTIFISGVELSYDQPDGEFSIDDDSYSYFAVAGGQEDGGNAESAANMFIILVGREAAEELRAEVGPEPVQVDVSVRVVGKTAAGARVESNELTFPVFMRNAATCPAGQQFSRTGGPCGQPGGQDAYPITCQPIP
jgi:hypothetical protein